MNVRECYELLHEDYDSVFNRLGSEEVIGRFLKRYIDKHEYEELEVALGEKRWEDAFVITHNMKGFGLNLSLGTLMRTSSALCEALRGGEPTEDITLMLSEVRTACVQLEEAVKQTETEV